MKKKKKPAKKRRPCVTAWFALDWKGHPVLCCVERTLKWHISSFPLVTRRAQFRLVPVKPARKAKA